MSKNVDHIIHGYMKVLKAGFQGYIGQATFHKVLKNHDKSYFITNGHNVFKKPESLLNTL